MRSKPGQSWGDSEKKMIKKEKGTKKEIGAIRLGEWLDMCK